MRRIVNLYHALICGQHTADKLASAVEANITAQRQLRETLARVTPQQVLDDEVAACQHSRVDKEYRRWPPLAGGSRLMGLKP